MAATLPWLLVLALALGGLGVAAVGLLGRARRWRLGRAEPVDWGAGLRSLPRRFLHDVHDVVARDRYAARMHMAAAGGLVGGLLVLIVGLPFAPWLLVPLGAVVILGGALVWARRFPRRPARLSGGAWDTLGPALVLIGGAFMAVGARAAGWLGGADLSIGDLTVLLMAALGSWVMLAGMGGGPMKHAPIGALHLAAHRRPERFAEGAPPASGLFPLKLSDERLGIEKASDFSWCQLLGFDACVQCGRCQEVCPAHAAGQPLSPKALIQSLVTAAMEEPAGTPIVGGVLAADTLWSCTTCRACVHACPMMIEHVDAVIDLRRFQALEVGAVPGKGAEAIENLRLTDTVGGQGTAARLDWAADLKLPLASERPEGVDVLLWMGEGAFDLRHRRTLRALVALLRRAGVDFAVLADEPDCGDVARRLGEEAVFQRLASQAIDALKAVRFNRIVSADPHALHALKREYRALGGDFSVLHHSELLAELVAAGRLPSARGVTRVTYHDPCYLGRYNKVLDAPRAVLAAAGVDVVEMERHGMTSHCCGWGGGAAFTDIPGERRIPDMRMEQAVATGAEVVAVACPNCAVMLEGVVGSGPQVADIAEILLDAIVAGEAA